MFKENEEEKHLIRRNYSRSCNMNGGNRTKISLIFRHFFNF